MSSRSGLNRRWLSLAVSMAVGLGLIIMLLIGTSTGSTQAQGTAASSAHVVVQFAEGATAVRPITWTGTITRVGALRTVGFTVETSAFDENTVCNIDGEGCPASDCFCSDNLWAQGQWAGTTWDTSAWPPPSVADGDVIAFRNGTQPDYSDWGLTGLLPGASTYVAASDALEWMRSRQQADGSYNDGFGQTGASVRALIVLGSAGYDPAEWGEPNSLLDFLTVTSATETIDYVATSASGAGKVAVGAAWTGQVVTDFVGMNLPISITAYYSPTTGSYGNGSGDTAWAILGLYASGESIPTQTIDFLKGVQNTDGGWAWNEWGTTSEVQHTALCVQALLAAGEAVTETEIVDALNFISSAKGSDGGYSYYQEGEFSDVNTSAFVLQSLLSAGQVPAGNWCTTVQCSYLFSQQASDGSFLYYGSSSLYATQDAIPALMHRPYGPLASWTYNCYYQYLPLIVKNAGGTP